MKDQWRVVGRDQCHAQGPDLGRVPGLVPDLGRGRGQVLLVTEMTRLKRLQKEKKKWKTKKSPKGRT